MNLEIIKKRYVCLVLSILMFLVFLLMPLKAFAYEAESINNSTFPAAKQLSEESMELGMNQLDTLEAFLKPLTKTSTTTPFSTLNLESTDERYSDTIYPEDFAGIYFGDDGLPVMRVKVDEAKLSSEKKDSSLIKSPTGSSLVQFAVANDIHIEAAAYSTNELNKIMDIVTDAMRKGIMDDLISVGRSDKNNNIQVGIYKVTPEKIETFKNEIIDEPMLVFNNESEVQKPCASVFPASGISTSGGSGSAAYAAQRNVNGTYYNGFFTTAHMGISEDNPTGTSGNVTLGGTIIGVAQLATISTAGIDAAFIDLNIGHEAYSQVSGNQIRSVRTPHDAMPIRVYGKHNNGVIGTVTTAVTSVTVNYNPPKGSTTLTNMARMSVTSVTMQPGDSGGLVVSTPEYAAIGIITTPSFFCWADRVNQSFNATLR